MIALDQQYTKAIDIWSVGCIVFELIMLKDEDQNQTKLFKADFFHPLSPQEGKNQTDLIDKILMTIGLGVNNS